MREQLRLVELRRKEQGVLLEGGDRQLLADFSYRPNGCNGLVTAGRLSAPYGVDVGCC